jgi:hypothetical protein
VCLAAGCVLCGGLAAPQHARTWVCCCPLQDEEDAKKGLYNWFAQSQRLLTAPRLLFSTCTALLVPLAVLGLAKAVVVWATVLCVTVAAGLYSTAIIGGVVGDFLGATIQVRHSRFAVPMLAPCREAHAGAAGLCVCVLAHLTAVQGCWLCCYSNCQSLSLLSLVHQVGAVQQA